MNHSKSILSIHNRGSDFFINPIYLRFLIRRKPMIERKEYAIVRFFEQGGRCYKIDDVENASNLLQFTKEEESIEKKQFFLWFASLLEQLEYYHKSTRQGYGYVNPYAVIINNEGKAVLLDLEAKENSELLKRMQKKNFRSLFVRDGNDIEQIPNPEDDVYGFGKLMLFMIEKGKFEKGFSKLERIKLKRIIEQCTCKKGNVKVILKNIRKELNKMSRGSAARRTWGVKMFVAGTVIIVGVIVVMLFDRWPSNDKSEQIVADIEESVLYDETVVYEEEEGESLALELGMLYYSELGDGTGAREILSHVKGESKATVIYLQLFDYIQKGISIDEGQWSKLWQELKVEWERLGVQNKFWYKIPVLEACKIRNTKECWKIVCEIGEDAKENCIWNGIADDPEKEQFILQYLKEAYESLGDEEKAREAYESLQRLESYEKQSDEMSEEGKMEVQESFIEIQGENIEVQEETSTEIEE